MIQPSWLKPGEQPCRREVEIDQAEQENGEGSDDHRRRRPGAREAGRSKTSGYCARRRSRVRRRQLAHARASLPNSRPRTQPVRDIDDEHGDDDHQQDRADVGIVEFPDRDDELLADAAGADEAHHRGAAHVDLEAQQRVAGKARRDLRHAPRTACTDSQLAPVERTPSTGFMSMFSTISENSLPSAPTEWIVIASTPAIGPRPKAITKISANTMSGTVRQNSSKPLDGETQPGRRRGIFGGQEIQGKGEDRPGQRCRHS